MFGSIGIFELILIAGVALMILGPEKFPEFAKMAARFVKDIRSYANEIQHEVAKEIKPMTKELADLRRIDPEKYLDKLAGDDEEDEALNSTPPNPEPHPAEMGFDVPEEPEPPTEEESAAAAAAPEEPPAPPESVAYGDSGDDSYPREENAPGAEPEPEQPERLDG
jgi:sec-independent protein translocase protein TatB